MIYHLHHRLSLSTALLNIVFTRKAKISGELGQRHAWYCKPINQRAWGILYDLTGYGWCYPDERKRLWQWHRILVINLPF